MYFVRTIVVAACLCTIATLAASGVAPEKVYACSTSADFNPVAESDVIVAGRVTHVTVGDKGIAPGYVQVRFTLQVDRYLKGGGPASIVVVDPRSVMLIRPGAGGTGADYLNVPLTDIAWAGASGACGILDENPMGRYFAGGLRRTHPDTYDASRPLMFAWGIGPDDPRVVGGIMRAQQLTGSVPLPPATGNAGLSRSGSAATTHTLAFAAVVAMLARRMTRRA